MPTQAPALDSGLRRKDEIDHSISDNFGTNRPIWEQRWDAMTWRRCDCPGPIPAQLLAGALVW